MSDLNLKKMSKDVTVLLKDVPARIATQEQYEEAARWLIAGTLRVRAWEARLDKIAKPLRESLSELRKHTKEILGPAEAQFEKLEGRMLEWLDKELDKATEAKANGQDTEAPVPQVLTEAGMLAIRSQVHWRLKNYPDITSQKVADCDPIFRDNPLFKDIPDDCWELNLAKVGKLAKAAHPALETYTVRKAIVINAPPKGCE